MTDFPKKKFADHDTTDEMAMLGYGYNLAIDDYQKAIRDNLPSVEEIMALIEQMRWETGSLIINGKLIPESTRISMRTAEAIVKLYKDRLT